MYIFLKKFRYVVPLGTDVTVNCYEAPVNGAPCQDRHFRS